ncbi:glucokinase [Catalinimonas alkaloidigena]|uniref:Glucokinase n=1 Tax=Catalinimonas alkaloidigena TaxID=1075417 RepID=A0A1G9KC05_9BACT|nr:ROK family protein [Catalinimonas alkaloidigena]SDL46974.1 glucokinase [Catalinimonas alkaloidigena]
MTHPQPIPVTLGIDIGGTNTAFGLVDRLGNILTESTLPTKVHPTCEEYLRSLNSKIRQIYNDHEKKSGQKMRLIGIGIGAPNANYYRGTIEYAPNLTWPGVVPFVEMMKGYFDVPIVLTNDANAAAVGEMVYGGAKGLKNFVVITLGTGLGSGLVVNGELVYGHDGFAGELGHITVNPDGRHCGCGRKGCLETYVSATGIKRTVYKLLADFNESSELRNVPFNDLTAYMISEAARRGDRVAIEAFEYTGRILGQKLADTVAHTSPEAIFLFGGLAQANELIFYPTQRHMEANLLNIYKNKVKILPSELMDKNAAVLGASALAWKELESEGLLLE